MKNIFKALVACLIFGAAAAQAADDGMPGMPRIEPKRTYVIKSAEDGETLQDDRGFGEKNSEVSMMNLMMVEGSGYEGMDMKAMGSMKMGSRDSKPAEHPMAGMNMDGMKMAASDGPKNPLPSTSAKEPSRRYSVEKKNSTARAIVGTNLIEFSITDTQTGKSAKGLKLKAEVSMSSMDMGTETPRVRESAPGKYQVKAAFSMKGPWALKIILPDGNEEILPFNAEKTQ